MQKSLNLFQVHSIYYIEFLILYVDNYFFFILTYYLVNNTIIICWNKVLIVSWIVMDSAFFNNWAFFNKIFKNMSNIWQSRYRYLFQEDLFSYSFVYLYIQMYNLIYLDEYWRHCTCIIKYHYNVIFLIDFNVYIFPLIAGHAALTLRSRLQCVVLRKTSEDGKDKKKTTTILVLNEVVVDRGPSPYLSNIDLFLDGKHITSVQGDGEF